MSFNEIKLNTAMNGWGTVLIFVVLFIIIIANGKTSKERKEKKGECDALNFIELKTVMVSLLMFNLLPILTTLFLSISQLLLNFPL